MMIPRSMQVLCAMALISSWSGSAFSSVPIHIVKADLKPLIRAAAESPVQFAVLVPHAVSASKGGTWSTVGQHATWTYADKVPTAVSLSFHATQSSLPAGARLIVRGTKTTTSYGARDFHRGELWSRIQPGDTLEFSITVDSADRGKVSLNIVALQAGYRSVGPGVNDHPYYRQLKAQEDAASGNASCVTNYECEVNANNAPPGSATVALVVGNLYQCTGSLVNDVPGDNAPYVLTARHCETGKLGGGSPSAAATITVYWNATTPCNATALGSIYDPTVTVQTGAQTVVEQQDAWLIELDDNPVVADAQFAGFDASGGPVQGGYTIQHSEGYDKQFTAWFGQAASLQQSDVLTSTYVSNFLETVNSIGNFGPGASGGGLFDQNNHLVGSLTLGRKTNDVSGYGSCPAPSPPTPNGTNGVADFTSLAAVWTSTADTTSSTGNATIKSMLDPNNSGTLVTSSAPVEIITFSPSSQVVSEGLPLVVSWNAPGASGCTATGGVAGDGWSGSLAASGTRSITEATAGLVTYGLSCTYTGGRVAKAVTTVDWVGPTPNLSFTGPYAVWTTRPAVLSWTSNLAPCSITGGGLSLTNLPATGTTTATQAVAAEVTYTLTCGAASNQGSTTAQVMYVTPSLILEPTGTDRILGQTFVLNWHTFADSCVAAGGAPNDGWGTTAFTSPGNNLGFAPTWSFVPHVATVGTYTYTLACTSGAISVQQSVTVTFENNAPYTTASLSPASVTFSNSPADYVTLNWNSNASSCIINTNPDMSFGASDPLTIPYQAQGSAIGGPPAPGTYVISVTCAIPGNNPIKVTSSPLTLTVLPPASPTETIKITPATLVEGQSMTVSWSSTNANYCAASGGIPSTGWDTNGAYADPPTGEFTYIPSTGQLGQFTFTITCNSIAAGLVGPTSAHAELSVAALTASLHTSSSSVTVGNPFTLTWSSNGTACTASGGGADGKAWSGAVSTTGTLSQTATESGAFTYSLVCSSGILLTASQAVTVAVAAQSSSGSGSSSGNTSSSGGSHGGGSFGSAELALLSLLICMRHSRQVCRSLPIARRCQRRVSRAIR